MDRRTRRRSRVALAAVVACVLSQHVAAMQEEPVPPPQPNRALTLVTPVIGYGIMALATASLVVVSLMKSRRGAQD
jgi:hypothetical protein